MPGGVTAALHIEFGGAIVVVNPEATERRCGADIA